MKDPQKSLTIDQLKKKADKFNDKMLSDLEEGFKNDFTVEETCLFAGIHKDTFYEWLKLSDEFAVRMDKAKQYVAIAAKNTWARAVRGGDIDASIKWLERRQKKLYSLRQELTGEDGEKLIPILGGKTTELE